MTRVMLVLLAAAFLVGCATSGAMQIGENEWLVQSRSLGEEQAVADAVEVAAQFCANRGKRHQIIEMQPVSSMDVYSRRQVRFSCK